MYVHLASGKGAMIIQWRKIRFFQQCRDNEIATCKNRILDPRFISYSKINSKLTIELNLTARTKELLGKIIGENLCRLGLDKEFLDMTPKE